MGVRERLQLLRKVFGPAEPAAFQAGEEAAGMTPARPFSPGEPIGPYDGYSRNPRTRDFVQGYNINARPRSHERIPFDTLRNLIDAYDVAQMAIWHRIESIRSLEWSLVAADGYEGDVSDAVAIGMKVLESPDRENDFSSWLASYLYDILAYDAGTLYRIRNRTGQTIGLRVVDGQTIAPLQDYWGNVPSFPAEAYVQYVNGLPWNWLTTRDLIYKPVRKITRSPYGQAPLETIILNANTDLRFQAYFLQFFTDGNIPAAFAGAPETWSPQQIEQFQTYWDAYILGDQAAKSQIKWIPGGSKIEFTGQREFSDAFSLHLMRKTLAAYHVVPSDMGFTQEINKSSGETQSDVQHRIGDVPLAKHISGIITGFLRNDLHLPIKFTFDLGEEQDDRLQTAQADKIYWELGAVGSSELREMRYGLTEAGTYTVPRSIFTTRGGPIPLGSLDDVAGEVDPTTGAPAQNAPRSRQVFRPVQGVVPVPPIENVPLAEQMYGPAALPPALPKPAPVGKEGAATGITAATGIYSYDGPGSGPDRTDTDDEDDNETAVAKAAELAAFRRYAKQRRRLDRPWRDFDFTTVDPATARELNDTARADMRKSATGTPGLTKRSGMISLDLPEGTVPRIPGGVKDHHITVVYLGSDVNDDAFADACRRAEEAARSAPGPLTGIIGGIGTFPPSAGSDGLIPAFATVALAGVYELQAGLADLSASEHRDYHPHVTLAYLNPGDPLPDPVAPATVTFTHLTVHRGNQAVSYPLGPPDIVKAAAPKDDAPDDGGDWPGWQHDHVAANHWAPKIGAALAGTLPAKQATDVAAGFLNNHPETSNNNTDRKALIAAAAGYLAAKKIDTEGALGKILGGILTDGYLIGTAAAVAVLNDTGPALPDWKPGNTGSSQARIETLGAAVGFAALLGTVQAAARNMAANRLDDLSRALADAAMRGDGSTEAGRALRAALADASRSAAIAVTEITRASSAGAMFTYNQHGVVMGRWLLDPSSKTCPRCIANAGAGPVPIGQPYPSGDANAPAHVRCRCCVIPSRS
jgi:hypothetical protein